MEKWDLYNAKREKTGLTMQRGENIPKGLYHLVVSVWIVNQQGQYLLSQRHPDKQYPLYWECTGGAVLSGENSLQGAVREVKEELGITLALNRENLSINFAGRICRIFMTCGYSMQISTSRKWCYKKQKSWMCNG